MGRYDWPESTVAGDDPGRREAHNQRFFATPNVRLADGSLAPPPPAPPRAQRRRSVRRAGPLAALPNVGPDAGLHLWLPIGPTTVVGGQATGRPRIAGRVRDLAIEPVAGQRVYAATASGGAWFSPNRGISWRPLQEFAVSPNRGTLFPVGNTLACGAIHVVWGVAADGSADQVVVGTGEPGGSGGTPGGKMAGIGILRATGPAVGNDWQPEGAALRGEAVWRIVEDPDNRQQQFAATTDGLYARSPGGDWSKVAALALHPGVGAPWNKHVVDVVVTRHTAPSRVRIWVARYGQVDVAEILNPPAPPAALNLTGLVFQKVNLVNALFSSRMTLSAQGPGQVWVLGKRQLVAPETIDPAHLWRIDASAALGTAAIEITGTPAQLFMSASDQSQYDMGLMVHPTNPNRLYLAGAAAKIDDVWNGALYRVDVVGNVGTPTLIGAGVHSDCHIVRSGPSPSVGNQAIWVGCDGGVFLSDRDGDPGTFFDRNTGLAVLQPGFVASHPTNDGIVAAGMQDNGTCERIGDTLWREPFQGDGGGVVYDPTHPNRYLRQYTFAHWRSSDGTGIRPIFRRNASAPPSQTTSEEAESNSGLFYTGAAAVAHGGTTHVAFGTNRVWYSPDWGRSWVTLPTGTDPRGSDRPDLAQDVLQTGTVNGQYTDQVEIRHSCSTETKQFQNTKFNNTAGLLTCKWAPRVDGGGNHRIRLYTLWNGGIATIDGSRPTGSTAPWVWAPAVIEQVRAPLGPEQASVDNGDSIAFLPATDLVNDIAVHDPARGAHGSYYVATIGGPGSGVGQEIDTVWWYNGDGRFVPCGVRRAHPRGVWSGLQIASPAMSVVVDPDDPDIVYVGTSVGVLRGVLSFVDNLGVQEPNWTWVLFDNGLPEAAVQDLSIFHHDGVKLMRAALQSRGVWETDLTLERVEQTSYLRVYPSDTRRRRPTPLTGASTNGELGLRWDASPDIVFDTSGAVWSSVGPSEADLFDLPFAGQVGEFAAQAFATRQFKVHVLVHHRWSVAAPPASVRVALLRHDGPAEGDVPLGGIWAPMLTLAGGGNAPALLPGDWVKAAAQLTKQPGAAVDTRMPRAVTFDVDLTGVVAGTRVTFLAVLLSSADLITGAEINRENNTAVTTVEDLTRYSRHAAARTLRLR